MKVKTNVRAGKKGSDNPIGTEDPTLPPPPVTRCVGI